MKRDLNGALLVLVAALCWGTTGTAQALAPASAQPSAIGAVRLAIGGLALLGYAMSRGALRRSDRWSLWTTLTAAASMAAYQLFFFAGVAKTGVAVGTVVGIGSAPILAGILGYMVRGERPSWRWGLATPLAVGGCGMLLAAGESIQVNPQGLLLALGAGAAYAVFTVASKRLLEDKSPEAVMGAAFALGALFLAPLLMNVNLSWLREPRGLAVALHLGLVTVALAYSLFARGLRQIPVASAATLTLAEPLMAATLGVFLLGEQLTPTASMGILLIIAGLAILSVRFRQPASRRSPISHGQTRTAIEDHPIREKPDQ